MEIEFEKPTEIVLIIDRSGSMSGLRQQTIDGVNEFIQEQKKQPGDANLTLVMFDTKYDEHAMGPIDSCKELTEKDYMPNGMTALHDAVGVAIGNMRASKPEKAIFCIVTDGHENSSREYTGEQIKKLVKECEEKDGWRFIYLGANVDVFAEADKIGAVQARAANFAANASGLRSAYVGTSRAVAGYRSGGVKGLADSNWQNELKGDDSDDDDDE
jgi:hypothetical protein